MAAIEQDDECSSVSLDLSCESSSFDGDDSVANAEEVSDLVLPRIFRVRPVSPYNFQPLARLAALRSTAELTTAEPTVSHARIDRLTSTEW